MVLYLNVQRFNPFIYNKQTNEQNINFTQIAEEEEPIDSTGADAGSRDVRAAS